MSFNPRARVGRDRQPQPAHDKYHGFQSTRPRGARLTKPMLDMEEVCFNPRARVGRDVLDEECNSAKETVSIHAPAWGATC